MGTINISTFISNYDPNIAHGISNMELKVNSWWVVGNRQIYPTFQRNMCNSVLSMVKQYTSTCVHLYGHLYIISAATL